jgi:hypothetical protein
MKVSMTRHLRAVKIGDSSPPTSWLLLASIVVAVLSTTQSYAAGPPKSKASDTPFVSQTQIAVTIVQASRPAGVFQADIGLLINDPEQRVRATALQPVLRDRWRRTTQEFANSFFVRGRVPDAVLLGQKLQTATDNVLGPGVARVLLASVIAR